MQCPVHKRKLTAMAGEGGKQCEVCGGQPSQCCDSCKFVLCGQCRICPARHFMLKIMELHVVRSYFNNKYNCDSCKQNKTVDDDGIWHCNACQFDVCPECAE